MFCDCMLSWLQAASYCSRHLIGLAVILATTENIFTFSLASFLNEHACQRIVSY